jgi:hypothetical protein
VHDQSQLERVTGIEPVWVAWKATARPLGHTRFEFNNLFEPKSGCDSLVESVLIWKNVAQLKIKNICGHGDAF